MKIKPEPLLTISPIDGRYQAITAPFSEYFSEFALIKYRVEVEVRYFIALCHIPLPQLNSFTKENENKLLEIVSGFSIADAVEIKEIEKTTNHDVKAVEYFLKKKFNIAGLDKFAEFIHFGLTSQDINNTAMPMAFRDSCLKVYFPSIQELLHTISSLVTKWQNVPMLARTHGQPASPTLLGKEIAVFHQRISKQFEVVQHIPFSAKFGGATGNFNAHHLAYPKISWEIFADDFVHANLKLVRSQPTTQIDHYDSLSAILDAMKRINTILIDMCRDFWSYISMDYFKQTIKENEIGSSAMPHKVNPIDFENAEGNLGLANALLEHLSGKLPISRLQRDLTDSTVIRNLGVPVAHSYLAITSIKKGLDKLLLNPGKIEEDLENNWAVVAEGIQTILRREGYPKPYEALKALTRTNQKITQESIRQFIQSLDLSETVKSELRNITPQNYTGIFTWKP